MDTKLVGDCKRCGGTGWVDVIAYTQYGHNKVSEEPCPDCNPDALTKEIDWIYVHLDKQDSASVKSLLNTIEDIDAERMSATSVFLELRDAKELLERLIDNIKVKYKLMSDRLSEE